MPQGSSAVRPTKGLYLYLFSESITLVSVRFPDNMDFRILLEMNKKPGKSIMTFIFGSATNINPKFHKKIYLYEKTRNKF